MTSRSLVPFLEQTKSREEDKDRRCGRRRVKQVAALIVVLVITLTCAILSAPNVTAPSQMRRIPSTYTHPENLAPEDRELLKDIRTSFVPTASIVVSSEERLQNALKRSEQFTASSPNSDLTVWGSGDNPDDTKGEDDGGKRKREVASVNLTTSVLIWKNPPLTSNKSGSHEIWDGEATNDYDPLEYEEDGVKGHLQQDDLHVDIPSYTSFQSFWKGEGDPESIRRTQSEIMQQYMDFNADPCVDFYQYACGNWALRNPIPADKAGFDTFEILRENLDIVLRDLLSEKDCVKNLENVDIENNHLRPDASTSDESNKCKEVRNARRKRTPIKSKGLEVKPAVLNAKAIDSKRMGIKAKIQRQRKNSKFLDLDRGKRSADKDENDAELKAKYLYESCMNHRVLEERGSKPLLELLDSLGGWPVITPGWKAENFDWLELMAKLRLYNNDILISEWVGPDIKNSDEFIIQFDQTSLGLPTKDYFLQQSNSVYLEAYKNYLIKICTLMGTTPEDSTNTAEELIVFETKLAKITSTPDERRNLTELYQRLTLEQLSAIIEKINWKKYLRIVLDKEVDSNETVVVFALKYMKDLVELIDQTEPRVVANYLLWRFIRHRVNNLDDRFQEAKQRFYYILLGRERAPPRWKNCVTQVNSHMGTALGSMFVKRYFDENSKNDTLVMTREIQNSFRELLNLTSWIDDETKILAGEKVDSMILKIGYPGYILDTEELNKGYQNVTFYSDTYFENTLKILQHLSRTEHSRLGQPVNKTVWNTAPAVVNAYYNRNKNQILFPAGILQPPFYHRYFPRSLNYGGIGVVIGHEITHGFDDKGRLFDKQGNLQRWWHDLAIDMFHKKAKCLIDQYDLYTVSEVSMSLDGTNTQGENIADNGGIKQAFRAYKYWLDKNGNADETLPGLNLTSTQLFFLNFAQLWCGSMRPEAMKNKLKIAVHSPGKFRAIGTLSNSDDFAQEYNCPPGSPMNPVKKCNVW